MGKGLPMMTDPNTATPTPAVTTTPAAPTFPSVSTISERVFGTMRSMSQPVRWIVAGPTLTALGSLLPWGYLHTSYGTEATSRTAGATLALLLAAASLVWVALPAVTGRLSNHRRAGLKGVAGLHACIAFGGWAMLSQLARTSHDQNLSGISSMLGPPDKVSASPGFGLMLYSAGVVAMVIGVFAVWRAERQSARTSE